MRIQKLHTNTYKLTRWRKTSAYLILSISVDYISLRFNQKSTTVILLIR